MAVNETNARIAYQYFIGKGLSPAQAAGIVGNLQAESGLNPESKNSLGCVGIAQWCYGRRTGVQVTGDPAKDLPAQLDYMWYELQGPEQRSLTALGGATTPAQAALAFEAAYERSGGALLAQRQQYATEVATLAASWGLGGTTTPATTPPTTDTTGSQTVGLHVPNPLSALSFLDKLWHVISSANFWLRVGQIILGFFLLVFGVTFMVSETKAAGLATTALAAA